MGSSTPRVAGERYGCEGRVYSTCLSSILTNPAASYRTAAGAVCMTPHGHADRLADPGGRAGNKRTLSPQLTPIPDRIPEVAERRVSSARPE